MKFVFSSFYPNLEENFGYYDGGTSYGHRLLAPNITLRNKLEKAGHEVLTPRECSIDDADVAIFLDLNETLYKKALSLSKEIPCILISTESPIYSPLSHRANILFSNRWSAVMTWNRAYSSDHIYHYDIAFAGVGSYEEMRVEPKKTKGVVVSSYKNDPRGLTPSRDALFKQLAHEGYLDVYGMNWRKNERNGIFGPSPHKIQTMSNYEYTFISENSIYAGYVTEKIADAIIAGMPSIYFGDYTTAMRRFPGTFVRLEELTRKSFLESRDILYRDYKILLENVKKSRLESELWSDSFIDTFFLMVGNLEK
jgi:hypothetical protein